MATQSWTGLSDARASTSDGLNVLRTELDRIDDHLIRTLKNRIACCVAVAYFKREHGIPMMQPQRVRIVQQRVAQSAINHGIDADFLRRLYDLIISETCRLEDVIIGESTAAAPHDMPDSGDYNHAVGGGISRCERS